MKPEDLRSIPLDIKDDEGLPLFDNNKYENVRKFSDNNAFQLLERVIERAERLAVILWHDLFDEVEAAMYLRLPDPQGKGRETIRYYALRTHNLSFHKFGKNGLIFTRSDLDKALKHFKFESHRDL